MGVIGKRGLAAGALIAIIATLLLCIPSVRLKLIIYRAEHFDMHSQLESIDSDRLVRELKADNHSELVLRNLVEALSEKPDRTAGVAIRELAGSDDDLKSNLGLAALRQRLSTDSADVSVVLRKLISGTEAVRANAALTLSHIVSPSDLTRVVTEAISRSASGEGASDGLRALARISGSSGRVPRELFILYCADGRPQMRLAATLGLCSRPSRPYVLQYIAILSDELSECRSAAANALREIDAAFPEFTPEASEDVRKGQLSKIQSWLDTKRQLLGSQITVTGRDR